MTRMAQSRSGRVARIVAVSGLGAEVGVVGALAGNALMGEVAGRASVEAQGWAFIAYLALALVALLVVLRGVWQARPWSKAPAVTLQLLILLAGGVPLLSGGRAGFGLLVCAVAVVAGLAVLMGVPSRTRGPWDIDDTDAAADSTSDPGPLNGR